MNYKVIVATFKKSFVSRKRKFLVAALLIATSSAFAQTIVGFNSQWYKTFSANSGGFGRGIIDNGNLVISGGTWPTWPSGTTDQMITKIDPSGNTIFQIVRSPGGDHDGYSSVVKLLNGNYGFFGQENAQGTQYFDGFYTEFDNSGNEISYNFFSVSGSSNGTDMLMLPNGNRFYTGNHGGGGSNFIALTDPNFNQLNYKTFSVSNGGWNVGQLAIDNINNFVYAIGSELNSNIIIAKYDFTLNSIASYTINNNSGNIHCYDVVMDGSDLLLCGYKTINGVRLGAFYRVNSNGNITDSLISPNNSEFTAITKYGNQIILAKSNLSGTSSVLNELMVYSGNGILGITLSLHNSSPFVPFDLVLDGNVIYAVGAQGQDYWIGKPAVEKIIISGNTCQLIGGLHTITPDGPTTFCAGNSVNLKSDVVGGTYQWRRNGVNITTNATSRTFKATSSGSYTCVATCNGTALTSNAIQVTSKTNASASVTASGATSFCAGDSVTLNCTNLGSNYSVQWYRTNISMENATNYSTVVKQPGTYKVVTRNLTNGCSRISGSAITTSVNCRIAGDITSGTTAEETTTNAARLIDNELSQGVHIYPNPNTGSFNFTYDGEETGDGILQIINTMGQSIYNSAVTVQEGGYNQEIQLGDNFTKGIYIVRLLINGSYHDSRVMVR